MPGLVEAPGIVQPSVVLDHFTVIHQKIELDIDLRAKKLTGRSEILVHPHSDQLKHIRLNFRQGEVDRVFVSTTNHAKPSSAKRKAATFEYSNSYDGLHLYGAQNHHRLAARVEPLLNEPLPFDLDVYLPRSVHIQALALGAQIPLLPVIPTASAEPESNAVDTAPSARTTEPSVANFTPLTVHIEFHIDHFRDGLHFAGLGDYDCRYPHAYTRPEIGPGMASSLFPCVDDLQTRCTWEIGIKCHRTLGDAFKPYQPTPDAKGKVAAEPSAKTMATKRKLSEDDEALELSVCCSGDLTDEIVDPQEPTKKTSWFACNTPLAPEQLGFALGPFEHIDLSEFRESDEDALLGQKATPLHAFCLPGRANEVRSACLPVAKAIDWFSLTYGSYPFTSWKVCFMDDLVSDSWSAGSMSLLSSRLLFPEEVQDILLPVTRAVILSLASQWSGVNIVPKEPTDTWATVGIASYMTDMFMKLLCGNNEYRFRLKEACDRICELDHDRPSMEKTGALLRLEPSQLNFIYLKAPVVLFILERRLTKASGKATLSRIIHRLFLNAQIGDLPNGALSTAQFQKTCERLGHTKLDQFFSQWVSGAGCPRFTISQRFNKKKLIVEMVIRQTQSEQGPPRDLEKESFLRDVREDLRSVYADPLQHVFTGSMTIRIHEADGTPYEHIVEIKEAVTKVEIPYNTKYKRLKRSKRQKERATAVTGLDNNVDGQDDVLIYCLGDVLQSDEEVATWRFEDWSKEDEEKMGQESYEWIRMDSDFEWICKMTVGMPGWMFLSQLQQDRDVVAQFESLQYLMSQRENPLVSTILTRTLMDKRYFYRIRTAAAAGLAKHAKPNVNWIGQFHLEKAFSEMFCMPDSLITRSNDFSDRASYCVQLAIPKALSQIRDGAGKVPHTVLQFLYDKLNFNDNSNNNFTDAYYIAMLVRALSDALLARPANEPATIDFGFEVDDDEDGLERQLDQDCIAEIDRYRRMDEWTPSFQNILSRTALDCQLKLMKGGVIDVDYLHFLQYTRPGISELLRETAFSNLFELGLFNVPDLLSWAVFVMTSDDSPRIRNQLNQVFGKALAVVAFGPAESPELAMQSDSLLVNVDQEAFAEARQAHFARRQTIEGALAGLKDALENDVVLRKALELGGNSDKLSPTELGYLIDWCHVLYEPAVDTLVVKLAYPFYWKCENLGKGIVKFFETEKLRTKPQHIWVPRPPPAQAEPSKDKPLIPIKLKMPMGPGETNSQVTDSPKLKMPTEPKEKPKNLPQPAEKEKVKLTFPSQEPNNSKTKLTMPKMPRKPSQPIIHPPENVVPRPQTQKSDNNDLKRKRVEENGDSLPHKKRSLVVKLKLKKFPPLTQPLTPASPSPSPTPTIPKLKLKTPSSLSRPTPPSPAPTTPNPNTSSVQPVRAPLKLVFKTRPLPPST